ncbi:hypothetical protein QOT17_006054 [Balamuthia mandrillaris]
MYTSRFFLLLLLLAVVWLSSSASARADIGRDIAAKQRLIADNLQNVFYSSLEEPFSLTLELFGVDLSVDFDTNLFHEGTISWDATLETVTSNGHFKTAFSLDYLSLAVRLTIVDQVYEATFFMDVTFELLVSAQRNRASGETTEFALQRLNTRVTDASISAEGLSFPMKTAVSEALSLTFTDLFKGKSEAMNDFKYFLMEEVIGDPLARFVQTQSKGTVYISASLSGLEEQREGIVTALVKVLEESDLGDFSNRVLLGQLLVAADGSVYFDFWIVDNDDENVSGSTAVEKLLELFESGSDAFATAGLKIHTFQVSRGESSGSHRLLPFNLF